MSKDLEVLESLDKLEECAYAMKDLPMSNWIDLAENEAELDLKIMNWVETIKFELSKGQQALLELKQIKEAEPSEAMESLERIDKEYATIEYKDFKICFNTIKQALIKVQEQEKKIKALEIIKNKKVNIFHIWVFDNYQQYKEHYPFSEYHAIEDMLTLEEFNFLKEVLENE